MKPFAIMAYTWKMSLNLCGYFASWIIGEMQFLSEQYGPAVAEYAGESKCWTFTIQTIENNIQFMQNTLRKGNKQKQAVIITP